jgi:hypothetical protein
MGTFRCLKGMLKNEKTTDSIAFSGFKFSRSGEISCAVLSFPGVTKQNVAAEAAIFMDLLILLKAKLSTPDQVHKKTPSLGWGFILFLSVDLDRFELYS